MNTPAEAITALESATIVSHGNLLGPRRIDKNRLTQIGPSPVWARRAYLQWREDPHARLSASYDLPRITATKEIARPKKMSASEMASPCFESGPRLSA